MNALTRRRCYLRAEKPGRGLEYHQGVAEQVSEADRDYMRRLGEFMEAVHADELAKHRSLSVNERLVRSERLSRRGGARDADRAPQDDLAAFFRRARELGLCDD